MEREKQQRGGSRPSAKKKWHEFEVMSEQLSLLRGLSCTHSARFKPSSRGQQAVAACCVAVVLGHVLEARDWRAHTLECALDYGDRLFRASRAKQQQQPPKSCCQLEPEFYVGAYKCRLCTEPGLLQGSGACELERALAELLLRPEAAYGVLSLPGGRFAGVWSRPRDGPQLYHFEAGPCDELGRRVAGSQQAAACLARCAGLRALRERLATELGCEGAFCVDRLSLVRLEGPRRSRDAERLVLDERVVRAFAGAPRPAGRLSEWPAGADKGPLRRLQVEAGAEACRQDRAETRAAALAELRLDGCRELWANVPTCLGPVAREPGAGILHGWSHELSELYKAKGMQSAANCAMALGMRRVHPVRTWLRRSIDEVLAAGDLLFARLKSEIAGLRAVTGAELHNAAFEIGPRKMIVDVDLLTIVGTIVSKVPAVLSLRQGLQEFLLSNDQGVLECSSLTVALWKEDDYYYLFDPRACDLNGLRVAEGQQAEGEKHAVGKACVIRLGSLASLHAHLMRNIQPTESSDRFVVRRVSIVDDVPGSRQWHSFEPAVAGKSWMLKGQLSSDSEIFSEHSRGLQSLAIAVVALVAAKTIPPDGFYPEDLHEVIRYGDSYYNWCLPYGGESEADDEQCLSVQNLKKHLYYKKCKVLVELTESCLMGSLQVEKDSDALDVRSGLLRFFAKHESGIIEANKRFFAVWRVEQKLKDKSLQTAYYLLHDKPTQSFVSSMLPKSQKTEVKSCVLRFVEALAIADVLSELLQIQSEEDQLQYFIHEMRVLSIGEPMTDEQMQKDKATPVRPELRNYAAFGDSGAILLGSIEQSNELLFQRDTRNRQQAANALLALAMSKIFQPYLWYGQVVDDILKMADRLTLDNLKNLPEADEEDAESSSSSSRNYLMPSEIGADFELGVNHISTSVEEDSFTGKLDELVPSLQEFFSTSKTGVYRQDKVILGIWREESVYFTMDPRGKLAGSACVYWLIDIESFAGLLSELVDKPDGSFFIDTVSIDNRFTESDLPEDDKPVGDEHWYNFSRLARGVWQIDCNLGQDPEQHDQLLNDKYQTALSVLAIVFAKAYEARFWSKQLLQEITAAGTRLHQQSALRLAEDRPLRAGELIHEFFVADRQIDLDVRDCVQAGKLISHSSKIQDLSSGCAKFFDKYSAGCLSLSNAKTLGIWSVDDRFYSFDPGNSLTRFDELALLVDQLQTSADEHCDFEISSVEVLDWDQLPPWQFDPSPAVRPSDLPALNAYSRLPGKARAILRGFCHQDSQMFPEQVRSRQSAANCIAALAMTLVKNPVTWTRRTLDEILAFGLSLHLESANDSPPGSLKPWHICRVFQMGANVLAVDVDRRTVSGIVEQPPPEPEPAAAGKAKKNAKQKQKKPAGKGERPQPAAPALLAEGLDQFFAGNRLGVLLTGRLMVALWRASGVYFVYDPRPRDAQGGPSEAASPTAGASCVCWFACKQPLLRLLLGNVREAERHERFEICRVRARRLRPEPLPGLGPPGFQRLGARLSALPAGPGWHMGAARFPAERRGLQSCAIACAGLLLCALRAPAGWTAELVRAALQHGDRLHAECARHGPRNLTPGELPRLLALAEVRARLRLEEGLAAGLSLERDLLQALELFFRGAGRRAGILHTAGLALGFARHSRKYYLLDPAERNAQGCACLLRCDDLPALADALVAVAGFRQPTLYSLNALHVDELRFFSR